MAKNKHKHEQEDRATETLSPEEVAAKAAAEAAAALAAEEDEASEPVKQEAEETADKAAGAEIEALTDRLKRTLAEFENFRKRSEREKAQMFDLGARSVLEKLLPVIDNFERSVAQAPESEDPGIKSYAEGMEMIYRQLLKNMKEAGVEPIDAIRITTTRSCTRRMKNSARMWSRRNCRRVTSTRTASFATAW